MIARRSAGLLLPLFVVGMAVAACSGGHTDPLVGPSGQDAGTRPDLDPSPGPSGDGGTPTVACETPDAGPPPPTVLPVTTTSTCTPGPSGTIAVTVTTPPVIPKGSSMAIAWTVANAPANASVGLYLVRNVADPPGISSPGTTGPLMLRAENACTATSASTLWDGNSTGCAPTDAPMYCRGVEPGEYRIDAVVYDRKDAELVTGLVGPSYVPPVVLARGSSAPFQITGNHNLSPLKSRLEVAVTAKVKEFTQAMAFAGTQLDRYVEMEGCELEGPDTNGQYCATFALKGPVAGKVRACGTVKRGEPQSVTGDISVAPGVATYKAAEAKAHEVADVPYRSRVGEGTTYLSTGITNWAYRWDGNYWVFVVFEIKAGGTEGGPDRFADNVTVRVAADGSSACVVATTPYSGGNGPNMFKDAIVCP